MSLVSKTALAQKCGVNAKTITRSMQTGILRKAMVGNRIDLTHEATQRFIEKHAKEEQVAPEVTAGKVDMSLIPEDIRKLGNKTLVELVDIFGTDLRFKDWLAAVKSIEEIHGKRLSNEKTKGEVIDRAFVKTHILGYIDASNLRLLNDSPRTIVAKCIEMYESGEIRADIETAIMQVISKQIKNVKTKCLRNLNG